MRQEYQALGSRDVVSEFDSRYDPSEEELDATIAEQRQCLPAWWEDETQRMLNGEDV